MQNFSQECKNIKLINGSTQQSLGHIFHQILSKMTRNGNLDSVFCELISS